MIRSYLKVCTGGRDGGQFVFYDAPRGFSDAMATARVIAQANARTVTSSLTGQPRTVLPTIVGWPSLAPPLVL